MFEIVYKGMNAGQMISDIHQECDTSAGLYSKSNQELIAIYRQVFENKESV